jgi:transcriptional regulator with XRE-family HTH domain
MSTITEVIKRLRGTLSQSEISRRTGIPQPRISRWEAGETPRAAGDVLVLLELEKSLRAPAGEPIVDGEGSDLG